MCWRESVKTNVPVRKATPSTIDRTVEANRRLWLKIVRMLSRNMALTPPRVFMRSRIVVTVGFSMRSTIRPSERNTMVSAEHAATGSWVTITMVCPNSRTASRMKARISAPARLSRLPVGSSAKTMSGRPASARATATRCCWPPDSSLGRWARRERMPTASITVSSQCDVGPSAGEFGRQCDVLQCRESRHQVVGLENEADAIAAHSRQFLLGQ